MDAVTTANISATFYDVTGTATGPISQTVGPNRSVTIDQRTPGGVPGSPSTYQGSAVLSSNTQVAAVVNEFGGTSALGSDFRFDLYNSVPSTGASPSVLMPQVLKNVYDTGQQKTWYSTIAIQNTSSTLAASVTITYFNTVSGTVTHPGISIPPGSSAMLDMHNELTGINAWFDAALVGSTQPVAVVVNQNAAGGLMAYRGFTSSDAATTLYFPQVLYNVYDSGTRYTWGTGMMVMTLDQSTSDVTITYYNTTTGHTLQQTKTASPAAIFDQRFDVGPMGEWAMYGTATLSSTKPIVALINATTNSDPSRGTRMYTSRSFPAGTGTLSVFVPELLKNVYDLGTNVTWSTGMQVRMMGTPAPVTMTYYLSDGTTRSNTYNNPSSQTFLIDQRYDGTIGNLSTASASAFLTSSQPFAVTINMVGDSNTPGDAAGNFAGINQ